MTLFALPFVLVGVGLAVSTVRRILYGPFDMQQIVVRAAMCLLFGGAGIGLMILSLTGKRTAEKTRDLVAQNPGKPWLWREDWASGYAVPETKSSSILMTVIGVAFLLFAAPMMTLLPEELARHRYASLLGLLFPLIAIFLLAQSLLAYLRAGKFRDARLTLAGVPGVVGGHLRGRVETQFVFPPQTVMDLTLSCVHSYVSGSGDSRSRWERVQWQDKKTAAFSTDGRNSYANVDFAIPYDSSETDTRNPDDQILWRLTATASLPGLDFRAIFFAPVFKTAESEPSQSSTKLEGEDEARLGGTKPAEAKIITSLAPGGGARFYLAPARNKQVAALVSLFGAVFLGGGLFFGLGFGQAFRWGWVIGVIPLTLSGGVGLFLLGYALWLCFGATTIEIVDRDLHIHSTCLGFFRSRVIHAADIRQLELYSGMQSGDKVWYDLKVRLVNGRSVTAGSGLVKHEAEWFRAEIKKDLAIADTGRD